MKSAIDYLIIIRDRQEQGDCYVKDIPQLALNRLEDCKCISKYGTITLEGVQLVSNTIKP